MKLEKFGHRLRRLRIERNLSIEEVARNIGISSSTCRKWENGRSIRGEPYVKMRDLFKVSLEELMTGYQGNPVKVLGEIEIIEMHFCSKESAKPLFGQRLRRPRAQAKKGILVMIVSATTGDFKRLLNNNFVVVHYAPK